MSSKTEIEILHSHIKRVIQADSAEPETASPLHAISELTEVYPSEIVTTVMQSVDDAQIEIIMTMLLEEEREKPLPPSYHDLIKRKVEEGITIWRFGFGNQEDFDFVKQNLGIETDNFIFERHPDIDTYQRCIMVDKDFLFVNFENSFYGTKAKPIIELFQDYFAHLISTSATEY